MRARRSFLTQSLSSLLVFFGGQQPVVTKQADVVVPRVDGHCPVCGIKGERSFRTEFGLSEPNFMVAIRLFFCKNCSCVFGDDRNG